MTNQFTFEYPSADAVMNALMTGDRTAPRTPSVAESGRQAPSADRFRDPDEIVICIEKARYEPSAVEAVVNALMIGAVVVACGIMLAMEGVQVAVA